MAIRPGRALYGRTERRADLHIPLAALGVGLLLIATGLAWRGSVELRYVAIERHGTLQIAGSALLAPAEVEQIERALDASSDVAGFAAQLTVTSQFQRGAVIRPVSCVGVEPENRVLGGYDIVGGTDLKPGDFPMVVIGRAMAADLGVGPGDYIRVFKPEPAPCGALVPSSLRISGIYSGGGEAFERHVAYIPLRMAAHLLEIDGAHKVVVQLTDANRAGAVAAALRETLAASDLDVEIRTWNAFSNGYKSSVVVLVLIGSATLCAILLLGVHLVRTSFAQRLVGRSKWLHRGRRPELASASN